jgi:glutathione peroxidase
MRLPYLAPSLLVTSVLGGCGSSSKPPEPIRSYTWMRAEQAGTFDKDAPGADKLYAHLQKTMPEVLNGDSVRWTFTKFLVDRKGHVVKRFESMHTPQSIEPEVVALLERK